jgi:hypothetical protein
MIELHTEKETLMSEHAGEFVHSQQQWEYLRLEAPAAESLNDSLKELGRDGWELASVVYSPGADAWHGFLKRPRAYAE